MRLADVERFTLLPYDEQTFDCADLVALVQRELFGRQIQMPGRRPRGAEGQAAIGELSRPYARRTEAPQDGDLVLMIEHGQKRPGHAGVYFWLSHEAYVLHANEKTGCSILHRARELPDYGLRIEGTYSWV
ncbi:peptidoglycan endopeptidase [Stenotrophomonas sp. STM01]|uniref:peptidoglycan endopeptidase n=1 Tax=Stenotrophomonas sp. STM01 TaxID=2769278 RepID=UPI00177B2F3A|nr:peptidoglycan endopeptidase [Stenotrophomonas sp. STM01]MBD9534647.1 peptidoglycan endopeptidase [Stenotrophomonas sp. STM01]